MQYRIKYPIIHIIILFYIEKIKREWYHKNIKYLKSATCHGTEGLLMKKYRIGVDLGGTNVAVGIVDENLSIVKKDSVKTDVEGGADAICRDIDTLCRRLCAEADIQYEAVSSIGIGSPGIIHDGMVIKADNLRFSNVSLAAMLEKLTGKSVILRNDGNAAAYGELVAGCGKGSSSLVAITLGTGVGGGIVIGGKIVVGVGGGAGEIGHTVIRAGGRKCVCGQTGCLEAYCSATALIGTTVRAMRNNPESRLWQVARSTSLVNGRTAFDAMRLGDSIATGVVSAFISDLAVGVSNVINLLQPEVVCIGGGISREGDTLIKPLTEAVLPMLCAPLTTRILAATLGNDAGIIGAAAE